MSLRARLLLAFTAVVLIPLMVLAVGIRSEVLKRLSVQYQQRVASLVEVIQEDLRLEHQTVGGRLVSLRSALLEDNRFRLAAVAGVQSQRSYLLDWAGDAMRLTGLDLLQIQDASGRILSSGHFRNEHGRLEPELPGALRASPDSLVLVQARRPEGTFLALVRAEAFRLGGSSFTLVGGLAVDRSLLARLARDPELDVSLVYPGGLLSSQPDLEDHPTGQVRGEVLLEFLGLMEGSPQPDGARILVTHPLEPLDELRRSMDRWILAALAAAAAAALLLAWWLSARISRPLAELVRETSAIDLDRLDAGFHSRRRDEVGTLSNVMGEMLERLRGSLARLREAERRATIGDLARQVNHDIKNGLIPIRNAFRHLGEVARERPHELPSVFSDRQRVIDSGIAYLEELAASYARLSPPQSRVACDLNGLIRQLTQEGWRSERVELVLELAPDLPSVLGDPVALRRILENLLANAVDSLGHGPGRITVTTERVEEEVGPAAIRLMVADTGEGMSEEQLQKIFTDFYTTKDTGTGLGLTIVRRLVQDLRGSIGAESEPGSGSRFIVMLPGEARTGSAASQGSQRNGPTP